MKKRITSMVALIFGIILMMQSISLAIFAVDISGYTSSDTYKTSKYYNDLKALVLTGDQRYDVISVAITQLGYHEGNSDVDFDGRNANGFKNFVEYNIWYGKLDNNEGNGVSYGYNWCASFVSWCLRQAQIPTTIAPSEISCDRMVKLYIAMERYQISSAFGGTYVPTTGDVIFFEPTAGTSFKSSHVGLVRGVVDGRVYTIEGNSGGKVTYHNYSLVDTYIVGYGTPNYTEIPGTNYSDFELVDYKAGEFVVTATTLNLRSGIGTSYGVVATMNQEDVVTVSEFSSGWGKITYNGITGWASMSYLSSKEAYDYYFDWLYITYDANGGSNAPTASQFLEGNSVKLTTDQPTRTGYVFLGWGTSASATSITYLGGEIISQSSDTTLYALWEAIDYTVVFKNYDGTLISSEIYHMDDKVVIPENPTHPSDEIYNYVFDEWDTPVSTYVRASKTYTAKFIAVSIIPDTTNITIDDTTNPPITETTAIPNDGTTIIDESTLLDTTIIDTSDIPAFLDTVDDGVNKTNCRFSSMILNIFAIVVISGSSAVLIFYKKH